MIVYVDTITHHFWTLIAKHLSFAAMVREIDQLQRAKSYVAATFLSGNNPNIQDI